MPAVAQLDGAWTPAGHLGVLLPKHGRDMGAAAVASPRRQAARSLQHPDIGDAAYRAGTETLEFTELLRGDNYLVRLRAALLHRFMIHGRRRLQARILVLALLPLYSFICSCFLFPFPSRGHIGRCSWYFAVY